MNVLVESSWEIYFVDADSFQVEGFPCPVGMATFRAPEISQANYSHFLRTKEHEYFAIACLVFNILMAGKAPFSYLGGGDPGENIRKGNFPYATSPGTIPPGAYRYIWSYFPRYIQQAFTETFGRPDSPKRPNGSQWAAMLSRYSREILHSSHDAAANAIWPVAFKPWNIEGSVQLICASCRTPFLTTPKDAERRRRYPLVRCGNCASVLALAKKAKEGYNPSIAHVPTPVAATLVFNKGMTSHPRPSYTSRFILWLKSILHL